MKKKQIERNEERMIALYSRDYHSHRAIQKQLAKRSIEICLAQSGNQ